MFKPRGFTIFGYHCSYFVFLSKSEILDAVKTGQRLGVLCRKAAVFLSMNIPDRVNMWSAVHQCMNNELFYVIFVLRTVL